MAVWMSTAPPAVLSSRIVALSPDESATNLKTSSPDARGAARDDAWLMDRIATIRASSPLWQDVAQHRVQVLVTRVLPGEGLSEHGFRVDAELFYPASAIKTFVAVAALRQLQWLAAQQVPSQDRASVTIDSPLCLCRFGDKKCRLTADPTNVQSGRITVGHEIRKMLLVSNNVAYNRLFDFVGHQQLNTTFARMGLASVRIRTRFQGGATGGRVSPPMRVGSLRLPERVSQLSLGPAPAARSELGEAFYDDAGKLQDGPADFRFKNYASLRDLHRLMIGLVRPELPGAPELGIHAEHRRFLVAAMEQDPRASANPEYRGNRYDIERFKGLLRGARRALPASDLRGVSKSGRAYGFEVDNAYLEHRPSGRAMFVTVAVYANPNQVINDNGYAYHLTGRFVEALGEELARSGLQ